MRQSHFLSSFEELNGLMERAVSLYAVMRSISLIHCESSSVVVSRALVWRLRRNIRQFAENKRVGERAVVMPVLSKVCFLNKATLDENRLASQIRDRSVRFEAMQSQGVECVCEHCFDGLKHDALSP